MEHHLFIRVDKLTFKAEHPYFTKTVHVVKLPSGVVGGHLITRLGTVYTIFKIVTIESGANHYKVVEVN